MEEDSDAEEDERLLNELKYDANVQEDDAKPVTKFVEQRQFWCVPILADVMQYDFAGLGEK